MHLTLNLLIKILQFHIIHQTRSLVKNNEIDFKNTSFSYSNITANVQDIWALVENNDLDTVSCLGLKRVATLYVERDHC